MSDETLRAALDDDLRRELWRRAKPGHTHVIPLGYGVREAHEGDTYSLVGCWECGQMLAIAPGGAATRAALAATTAKAEGLDARLIDAAPKMGALAETIEMELDMHNPGANGCGCGNQLAGESYNHHIATMVDYRLTATDGDA